MRARLFFFTFLLSFSSSLSLPPPGTTSIPLCACACVCVCKGLNTARHAFPSSHVHCLRAVPGHHSGPCRRGGDRHCTTDQHRQVASLTCFLAAYTYIANHVPTDPVTVLVTSTFSASSTVTAASTTASTTASSSSASATSTTISAKPPQKSSSFPKAAIIGVAAGGGALLLALAGVLVVCCRRRRRNRRLRAPIPDEFFTPTLQQEPSTAAIDEVDRYAVPRAGGRPKPAPTPAIPRVTVEDWPRDDTKMSGGAGGGEGGGGGGGEMGSAFAKEVNMYTAATAGPAHPPPARTGTWPRNHHGGHPAEQQQQQQQQRPQVGRAATSSFYGAGAAGRGGYAGHEYVAYQPPIHLAAAASSGSTREGPGFRSPEMHLWRPGE